MKLKVKIEKYIEVVGYIINKYGTSIKEGKLMVILEEANTYRRFEAISNLQFDKYRKSHPDVFFKNITDLIHGKGDKDMQEKWDNYFYFETLSVRIKDKNYPTGFLKDDEKEKIDKADKLYHYHRYS